MPHVDRETTIRAVFGNRRILQLLVLARQRCTVGSSNPVQCVTITSFCRVEKKQELHVADLVRMGCGCDWLLKVKSKVFLLKITVSRMP